MKTNILTPIAALAVFAFSLPGCSSSENLDHSVTAMSPATENQVINSGFETQYEAETRSAGLAYETMFSDIENTANYNFLALAEKESNLSTFVELMREAGMLAVIDLTGQSFTIFAPTNAAFEALPAGRLEELREPQNRTELIGLLQAHMLSQPIQSAQFENNQQIQFGNDQHIVIKVADEGARSVEVGGANIVKPDVMASNGVIHIIDAVIQPVGTYHPTE